MQSYRCKYYYTFSFYRDSFYCWHWSVTSAYEKYCTYNRTCLWLRCWHHVHSTWPAQPSCRRRFVGQRARRWLTDTNLLSITLFVFLNFPPIFIVLYFIHLLNSFQLHYCFEKLYNNNVISQNDLNLEKNYPKFINGFVWVNSSYISPSKIILFHSSLIAR